MATPSYTHFKTGWLQKQSKHLKLFKTRWLEVYHHDKLCSFRHPSDQSPTEIIDLIDVRSVTISKLQTNEFVLCYGQDGKLESRRFRCSSELIAVEWMLFFNQQLASNEPDSDAQTDHDDDDTTLTTYTCTPSSSLPDISNQKIQCLQVISDTQVSY